MFPVFIGMNWYKKSSDRGMKYRNMPFAPLNVDDAFMNTGEFSEIMRKLEGMGRAAEDREGFMEALAKIQLAFLGNMYHPGGNSNMRALMPNENTDVMR